MKQQNQKIDKKIKKSVERQDKGHRIPGALKHNTQYTARKKSRRFFENLVDFLDIIWYNTQQILYNV